jgi:hypothetical protein
MVQKSSRFPVTLFFPGFIGNRKKKNAEIHYKCLFLFFFDFLFIFLSFLIPDS